MLWYLIALHVAIVSLWAAWVVERGERARAEHERDLARQQRDAAQATAQQIHRNWGASLRRPRLSERDAVAEAGRIVRQGDV